MTDFFDDDLDKVRRKEPSSDISLGPRSRPVGEMGLGEGSYGGGGELNLTRMSRHKVQVEDQVATAMKELEQLRQRQEDLQSQKKDLEELRKKQTDFETGKRDLLDRMNQSLVVLEKEEVNAEQLVDLVASSRKQFKQRIQELEALNDQNWQEENLRTELASALSVIDETRTEFNKMMAKIDVQRGHSGKSVSVKKGSSAASISDSGSAPSWTFLSALTLGLAFSLPLIICILLFTLVYYLVTIGVL